MVFSRLTFIGKEIPPNRHRDADHGQETGGRASNLHLLCTVRVRKSDTTKVHGAQTLENDVIPLPVQIVGWRDLIAISLRGGPYGDEPFGIRVRKGLYYDPVDSAENGGVGADAERQCQDGGAGKTGRLAEHAQAVTQVPRKLLEPSPAPRQVAFFFH